MKVKGRVLFKDTVTFNFGDTGLTVVHGLNMNGGRRNTNAAGKSLLMSTMQDLLYRDVLVGSRRDRVTEGQVSLEFGKTREETYKLVHSKKKLQVHKDGASLEIREQAEVDKLVKGILPATIEAYSTLVHLDNRVPHPLIRGESDARKKFFTKFFELDTTDPLRKLVSLDLAEIKSSGKLLADKKSRHAHLTDNKQNTSELRARLKKLNFQKDAMQAVIDEYQEGAALRQFVEEHKESLEGGSIPDMGKLTKRIVALQALIEKAESFADYSAELKAWRKTKAIADAYMEEHQIVDPSAELYACKILEKELEEYASTVRVLEEKISRIKEDLANLSAPAEHKGTASCDKCGAILTGKLMEKHKKAVEEQTAKYEAKKAAFRTQGKELVKQKKALVAPADDAADVEKRIAILRGTPKAQTKPEKPEGYGEETANVDELRQETKKLTALKDKYFWARGDLYSQALALSSLEEFLGKPDPTTQYMSLVDKISDMSVKYSLSKKADVELEELESFINEAETAATKAEALTILEKAYGTRGIRKVLINTVCQRLEEVLNSYSKSLLPEDYKFNLEMDTQFRIEVTRNGALPSDVRRLSGAESSLFSLLLWAGLMSFVPKASRPNVLILDELDANMSDETKERFCEFLPKLLNVVEHIVVVTPQSDVRYEDYVPNVKYVTVVKKGLVAKLVPGKAIDIVGVKK